MKRTVYKAFSLFIVVLMVAPQRANADSLGDLFALRRDTEQLSHEITLELIATSGARAFENIVAESITDEVDQIRFDAESAVEEATRALEMGTEALKSQFEAQQELLEQSRKCALEEKNALLNPDSRYDTSKVDSIRARCASQLGKLEAALAEHSSSSTTVQSVYRSTSGDDARLDANNQLVGQLRSADDRTTNEHARHERILSNLDKAEKRFRLRAENQKGDALEGIRAEWQSAHAELEQLRRLAALYEEQATSLNKPDELITQEDAEALQDRREELADLVEEVEERRSEVERTILERFEDEIDEAQDVIDDLSNDLEDYDEDIAEARSNNPSSKYLADLINERDIARQQVLDLAQRLVDIDLLRQVVVDQELSRFDSIRDELLDAITHDTSDISQYEEHSARFNASVADLDKRADALGVASIPRIPQDASLLGSTGPFSDVATESDFSEDIALLKLRGISQGYADGTFKPNNLITREQFVALLIRSLYTDAQREALLVGASGVEVPADVSSQQDQSLKDTVAIAYAQGITTGVSDTEFGWGHDIQRASAVTMLARAHNLLLDGEHDPFDDTKNLSAEFRAALATLKDRGVISGQAGMFRPGAPITRGEVAKVVVRSLSALQ